MLSNQTTKVLAYHPKQDRVYDLTDLFRALNALYSTDLSELADDLEHTQELLYDLKSDHVDEDFLAQKIILIRELKTAFRKMRYIPLQHLQAVYQP